MGIKLAPQPLIQFAVETSGLNDFGGHTFEAGMDALIHSLNTDIDLAEGTAGYFRQMISQLLLNRLEVTQLIKNQPEILDEKIEAPVFVVGLPRSGTSITHTLLALDPLVRYLRNFETGAAICPPRELIPRAPDPRVQAYHDAMEGLFRMAPELRGINGINFMAFGTAECQNLMAHEFVHAGWSAGSSLFSHGNWVSDCDMHPAYHWHKRLLQVLQWKSPNERWVLKAPVHLFGLDCLLEAYPDARIVFTHRDPSEAVASGLSMVANWTRITTGHADIEAISDWYPALWAKGLERALAVRKKLPSNQVFDLFHRDLCQTPIQTIEAAYAFFDIPLGWAARKRMQYWLRDNPRSKFGGHAYNSDRLGLDPDREKERFAFYVNRYSL
jgi:hypothetical protein